DEPQAPPQTRVAEVVRMAAVAPQAIIEHAATVRWIAFEACELPVGNRLEQETDGPQSGAGDRGRSERAREHEILRELHRDRNQPHESPLQQEDLGQRVPVEVGRKALAIRGGVARILAFTVVAPEEIAAEP